jgi:hypothetical protein
MSGTHLKYTCDLPPDSVINPDRAALSFSCLHISDNGRVV